MAERLSDLHFSHTSRSENTTPWWQWPQVLGLEIPLAAVWWQHLLAQAHGLHLLPRLDAGLALCCWLIHLTHRTLETFHTSNEVAPNPRAAFYLRHRRLFLLGVIPAICAWLMWAAFWVIPEGILWQAAGVSMLVAMHLASSETPGSRVSRDVFLSGASLGGILLISRMPLPVEHRLMLSLILLGAIAMSFLRQMGIRLVRWPSREFATALIFALGCTTSTHFLGMSERLIEPVMECLLLTLVFTCHLRTVSRRAHFLLATFTVSLAITLTMLTSTGALDLSLCGTAHAALGVVLLQALLRLTVRHVIAEVWYALASLTLLLPPLIL